MSLILEALRKSEAERQLGRAPGLLTPVSMQHAPASNRRWRLVALFAFVLLSAVAAAWWLGRSGVAEPPAASDTPAEPASAAQPTPIEDAPVPPQPAPATPTTPAPTAPIRDPMPAAGPADMPSDPSFQSTERESMPLPAPAAAKPASTSSQPIERAPVVEPPPAQPVATDAEAEAEPAPASSLGDEPPATPLRMLSAAERAGLPPLRLNMHVFAEAPERRFVMIDGRRLTEGDSVAADVVLMSIRRDGAVLEIRGHRVLIERP